MDNPWKTVSLSDYEEHMKLDSVMQLQTLNEMMRSQFDSYEVDTAMILGVAGGNGLDHIDTNKYSAVYGIDVNPEYLDTVRERYASLNGILQCLCIDLTKEYEKLPSAEKVPGIFCCMAFWCRGWRATGSCRALVRYMYVCFRYKK